MVINGNHYELRFTNRSLMNIEEKTGVGIFQLISDVEKFSQIKTIATIIWAGLNDENISIDDVIDSIDLSDYEDIFKEVQKAFEKAFDTGEKKKPTTKRGMRRKFGIG